MTTFIRLLLHSDKNEQLQRAVDDINAAGDSGGVFRIDPQSFTAIPTAPFAYTLANDVAPLFESLRPTQADGVTVAEGINATDNFRFMRLWWEVAPTSVLSSSWVPLAKGGEYARYYADLHLVIRWEHDGAELKGLVESRYGSASKRIYGQQHYFKPGITYSQRSQRGLSFRALPAGAIFNVKGPAIVSTNVSALQLLGIFNSSVYRALVELQTAFGSYNVGYLQRAPLPKVSDASAEELRGLVRTLWAVARDKDATHETSHAFVGPTVHVDERGGIDSRATRWFENDEDISTLVVAVERRVEEIVYSAYGLASQVRPRVLELADGDGASTSTREALADATAADLDTEVDTADDEESLQGGTTSTGTCTVESWLVGVAFGRFDPRLATGERARPRDPEPFDPLPSRSPGMYPEGEEPVARPDILVDDEGHADDLAARAVAIAERVNFDAPENLRAWLAKEFFPLHIKMYSKSRRKAPIYWQLATPSASYSVWLYIHAFSKDTLFRVQNDYVAPKRAHEVRRLESLSSELRDGATAAQRKQLAAQEALVEELRTFLDEVKRVAPLWKPNLDDGVIINFAPLWRLVQQNKAWQKELKSTWDALCEAKYDWAHLAMHLWPERVVPKCAKDRSLAIAHGLEDVFWVEGTDGKWTARRTPTRDVGELVRERTSPAVKSALNSLLEAPIAAGTGRRDRDSIGRKATGAANVS